jgi:two-component SAPR family response regulator
VGKNENDPSSVLPRRFLIIEDEPLIALMVAEQLREFGHIVVGEATTMEGAKCLAASADCDAAFLDLNLYGELSDAVGDILVGRKIPFAVMTGYNEIPSGSFVDVEFLKKPFTDDDMKRTVEALLAK